MNSAKMEKEVICIVGTGYVGLPLAVEFSKHFKTIAFDVNEMKITELKIGVDRIKHFSKEEIINSGIEFTSDPAMIKKANYVVIAVPTPINKEKEPDLECIETASELVGKNLKKGSIIIYESTVYPGVTEEVCMPLLEKHSGLKCGKDFKIAYSPERINPGDKVHTLSSIIKIVSGMDEETLEKVAKLYGTVIKAGIYKAKNIKVAEAAKVIENTQRDLNIALFNELALIFDKIGIETKDVIEAASTKWNFHKYTPGLVGGHCISVDPHYLLYKSKQLGYDPQVILAGRNINDYMPLYIAKYISNELKKYKKPEECKVLIMGLTFKENLNDTRNSKIKDTINSLKKEGFNILGLDPLLEDKELEDIFGIKSATFEKTDNIDCVILSTLHDDFKTISLNDLKKKMSKNPILFDVKSFFDKKEAEKQGFIYKSL
jgi:UDP-N-acetyl-D-galactosamine dehydrogenase